MSAFVSKTRKPHNRRHINKVAKHKIRHVAQFFLTHSVLCKALCCDTRSCNLISSLLKA